MSKSKRGEAKESIDSQARRALPALGATGLLLPLLLVSGLVCVAPDARPGLPSASTSTAAGGGGEGGGGTSTGGAGGSGGTVAQGGAGGAGGGSPAIAATPAVDWALRIGNQFNQFARSIDLIASGNLLIGGEFIGSELEIGNEKINGSANTDVFIAELSKQDGSTEWARPIGGNGEQRIGELVADPSGGNKMVLVGSFRESVEAEGCSPIETMAIDSDIYIARLASDGACEWIKSFGSPVQDQHAFRAAVNSQGNIAVAGFFEGSLDFGGSSKKLNSNDFAAAVDDKTIFVAALDSNGDGLFSRMIGITSYSDINDIDLDLIFDKDNNIIITGSYLYELNTANGTLQNSDLDEWFAIKLDGASGDPIWEMYSAESDIRSRRGLAVAQHSNGDLAFTGLFSGSLDLASTPVLGGLDSDIGLLVFDTNAAPLWSKAFGGLGIQRAPALSIDGAGNFLMGGSFNGVLDFSEDGTLVGNGTSADPNRDLFFAKLSSKGSLMWAMRAGDDLIQSCAGIRAGKGTESYAIGTFAGRIQLGNNTLNSDSDSNDVYVLKLSDQSL